MRPLGRGGNKNLITRDPTIWRISSQRGNFNALYGLVKLPKNGPYRPNDPYRSDSQTNIVPHVMHLIFGGRLPEGDLPDRMLL